MSSGGGLSDDECDAGEPGSGESMTIKGVQQGNGGGGGGGQSASLGRVMGHHFPHMGVACEAPCRFSTL